MNDTLATINGRLELIVHSVPWLKNREDVPCAVDVVSAGLVLIRPLERWAELHDIPPATADESLAEDEAGKWDDRQYPLTFRLIAKRQVKETTGKPDKGPSRHKLTLPALAALALFNQVTGPLKPQRHERGSGTVAVRAHPDAIELVGHPILPEPRTGA